MAEVKLRPRSVAAQAVRRARGFRGLTREDLATRMARATGDDRWTYEYVARIEHGRCAAEIGLMAAIAEVLALPIEWFIYGPDEVDVRIYGTEMKFDRGARGVESRHAGLGLPGMLGNDWDVTAR